MAPERAPRTIDENDTIDLLGLVAVTRLTAFERAAAAASLTRDLADKSLLAAFAVGSFERFTQVQDRLAALGADPAEAMAPFLDAVEMFHRRTVPADALEGLVKAYITAGIISDFFRELAARLADRDAVIAVLADIGHDGAMAERVRAAVAADPRVTPRLALWTRRVVGEALVKAVQAVSARKSLADLLPGPRPPTGDGSRLTVERVFERLSERHDERMAELGLGAFS